MVKAPLRLERSEELSEVPAGQAARWAFPSGLTNRDFSLPLPRDIRLSPSLSLILSPASSFASSFLASSIQIPRGTTPHPPFFWYYEHFEHFPSPSSFSSLPSFSAPRRASFIFFLSLTLFLEFLLLSDRFLDLRESYLDFGTRKKSYPLILLEHVGSTMFNFYLKEFFNTNAYST